MEKVNYKNVDFLPGEEPAWGMTGQRFTVPARGMEISLDPETQQYWADLVLHDGRRLEIDDEVVRVDGQPRTSYTLGQDYYFVLGDNSSNSRDSRYWGFVPEKFLQGNVFFKYWPPRRWGLVR